MQMATLYRSLSLTRFRSDGFHNPGYGSAGVRREENSHHAYDVVEVGNGFKMRTGAPAPRKPPITPTSLGIKKVLIYRHLKEPVNYQRIDKVLASRRIGDAGVSAGAQDPSLLVT